MVHLSEERQILIALIDSDWQSTGGTQVFGLGGISLVVAGCYVATLTALALAALGILVSKWQVSTLLCVYFCGAWLLAFFFFVMFSYMVTFSTVLEPVIERQSQELCNATLHWTYNAALHCSAASTKAVLPAGWVLDTCGADCKDRLEDIKRMGGCALLDALCHRYQYQLVGFGSCVVDQTRAAAGVTPEVSSVSGLRVSEQCCQHACNTRVLCQGYEHHAANGSCSVFSPRQPKSWVLQGQPDSDGESSSRTCEGLKWTPNRTDWPDKLSINITGVDDLPGMSCLRKGFPALVSNAESSAWRAGVSFLATALCLLGSSLCGCALQYTVVSRRKGRKGAGGLLCKMICSCCVERSRRNHKLGHVLHAETTSEEDSDYDDMASES